MMLSRTAAAAAAGRGLLELSSQQHSLTNDIPSKSG